MNNLPKSKSKWGIRHERSDEEINKICSEFFASLEVPKEWNFMGWDVVRQADGTTLSAGKVFRDMRTSGIGLMDYKVVFLVFSERGAICEKSIIDFGKHLKKCVISNQTIEKLNLFIKSNYSEIIDTDKTTAEENDGDDGLQSFRDRFGNNMAST